MKMQETSVTKDSETPIKVAHTVSVPAAAQQKQPASEAEAEAAAVVVPEVVLKRPDTGILPGAANHFVLNLDDDALKQTPINEMIANYGPMTGSTPGTSCEDDFGNKLVNRWRDTKDTYCSPDGEDVGTVGGLKSKIDCYLVKQTKHGGHGDQICVMENVGVHMDIFSDNGMMNKIVRNYEKTKHNVQPYVRFPHDFISSACEIKQDKWIPDNMPGWNVGETPLIL
jgi:hypothetical protein